MDNYEACLLANRLKEGDNAAFDEIYTALYKKVYFIALRIVKSEQDASDVVQNTFIRVMLNISKLRNPLMFLGWVNAITINECNRLMSSKKELYMSDSIEKTLESTTVESVYLIPDKAFDIRSQKDELMSIIELLPEKQKRIVKLYYFEDLKVREISIKVHMSEGMVKKYLFLARKALKSGLESTGSVSGSLNIIA